LWVSVETPLRRLNSEPDIPERTLERCLRSLALLLVSYRLATKDSSMYPVGPAGVSKSVPVGVRAPDGSWKCLMMLMVRPESGIPSYPLTISEVEQQHFARYVHLASLGHPFIWENDLELAAARQLYGLDDESSAVVSLQTSMESTLFKLRSMIMVDLNKSSTEIIAAEESHKPFKSLLTRTLPSLLGGQWNVEATGTAVGDYWKHLYLVRDRIVHSGLRAQEWQYDQAKAAYSTMTQFIAERLFIQWRNYPRTFTAWLIGRGVPPGKQISRPANERSARGAAALLVATRQTIGIAIPQFDGPSGACLRSTAEVVSPSLTMPLRVIY